MKCKGGTGAIKAVTVSRMQYGAHTAIKRLGEADPKNFSAMQLFFKNFFQSKKRETTLNFLMFRHVVIHNEKNVNFHEKQLQNYQLLVFHFYFLLPVK